MMKVAGGDIGNRRKVLGSDIGGRRKGAGDGIPFTLKYLK